jgi:cytochrome bd-type quinol oxidase subunit 2
MLELRCYPLARRFCGKERRGWLFLTSTPDTRKNLAPLISLWLDMLVLLAIFIVLCAILLVLVLMLPAETQRRLRTAVKFLLAMALILCACYYAVALGYVFVSESGGIKAALNRIPWWAYVLLVVFVIVGFGLSDRADNKKIRAGDVQAIQGRVKYLMTEFKYSREQADAAIERIRKVRN